MRDGSLTIQGSSKKHVLTLSKDVFPTTDQEVVNYYLQFSPGNLANKYPQHQEGACVFFVFYYQQLKMHSTEY